MTASIHVAIICSRKWRVLPPSWFRPTAPSFSTDVRCRIRPVDRGSSA